jgi:hypothetical protein
MHDNILSQSKILAKSNIFKKNFERPQELHRIPDLMEWTGMTLKAPGRDAITIFVTS